MVICVPAGDSNKTVSDFWEDSTRLPAYYDGTYQYLKSLGIKEIYRACNEPSLCFLKKPGTYYLATVDRNQPRVSPSDYGEVFKEYN